MERLQTLPLSSDEKGIIFASLLQQSNPSLYFPTYLDDDAVASALRHAFCPRDQRVSYEDEEQLSGLISRVRDELRDSEELPDLLLLPNFFRKPFPESARFPVPEHLYRKLPEKNRAKIFRPVTTLLGDVPLTGLVHAVLTHVDAGGTEDTFHQPYDNIIKNSVVFFYGNAVGYRRNSTSESSLRTYRPDSIYFFGLGYVLFKGVEKALSTEGDPAEELVDKDAWPYGYSLPYILAYYTRACSVTLCALHRDEQGYTRRMDLERFDISEADGRLDVIIACAKVAQIIHKLVHICERSKVLPCKSLKRSRGKSLEFFARTVVVTYEEGGLKACGIYGMLKGCPFIPKALQMNAEKGRIVLERGVEKQPSTVEELRDCIICVLTALVWLHGKNLMHRDLRWANVVKGGEREWWLVDFDDAWLSPSDGIDHLEPATHAPEIGEKHDCKVDIWGVGHLLSCYMATFLMPDPLKELAESCLVRDPSQRPTVAECLNRVNNINV